MPKCSAYCMHSYCGKIWKPWTVTGTYVLVLLSTCCRPILILLPCCVFDILLDATWFLWTLCLPSSEDDTTQQTSSSDSESDGIVIIYMYVHFNYSKLCYTSLASELSKHHFTPIETTPTPCSWRQVHELKQMLRVRVFTKHTQLPYCVVVSVEVNVRILSCFSL